jgi:uncharacterized MAPEG superfamily protein
MLVVGRVCHTLCYASKIGRPRTASYVVGLLGTLLMLIQILMAVY